VHDGRKIPGNPAGTVVCCRRREHRGRHTAPSGLSTCPALRGGRKRFGSSSTVASHIPARAPVRAPVLHFDPGMSSGKGSAPGHYGALGVQPSASPRLIEQAFLAWGDRLARGLESLAAYRRAESAYHVLATPDSRARHDRQLGLLTHPAWAGGRDRAARDCIRQGLRELGRGSAGRARPLLERAVSLDPRDPQARSYLALALARTGGSLHEAARLGRLAIERRPREAAFYFNLAEVYSTAGLRTRAFAIRARGWHALAVAVFRPHRSV
jgi:hypothetical protein